MRFSMSSDARRQAILAVATETVRKGKRRLYLQGLLLFGPMLFVWMNGIHYWRHRADWDVFYVLISLPLCELAGFLWSRGMWSRYQRMVQEQYPAGS